MPFHRVLQRPRRRRGEHRSARWSAARWARPALAGALLLPGLTVVLLAAPPRASAEVPAFLGVLAGPSRAAVYPSGLEVDPGRDRLVLADTGGDQVLFYTRAGEPRGGFGDYGTEPGRFASPRDVAVGEDGSIYVADAENNRVQKFTPDGDFVWQRGGLGSQPDSLNTPIGVTWDAANDVLLVASTGQSLVKAWHADGTFAWRSPSAAVLGTEGVRDVTRGPDGRLWVTAYKDHQIRAFDVSADGLTWDTTPHYVLGDGVAGGRGDGQLNFPYNVAFSPDAGSVYVSDTGNGRIARWDLTGAAPQWLPPLGGRCANHPQPCEDPPTDAGLFNHLRRVAVDADGAVYGADFWGAGVEVFAPDGSVLRSIEGAEPPAPGFAEAYGVDVAPGGDVYVMDRLNHRVQRFSAAGAYLGRVGARGTQPATFSWPEGLTVGPDGSVWVLDTRGDRLQRLPASLATNPVSSYGTTGSAPGELSYPSGADVAADGSVWVADTRNHRLQVLDPGTGGWTVVGAQGAGPGQLEGPMGVAVTATAVYVADTGNDRVQKLTLDGTPLAAYDVGLEAPEGVEVAPDGTVWVADTGHDRLVHLTADLADLGDGFGSRGTGPAEFFAPHDLAFGDGRMYVADTYNDRVQVFTGPTLADPPPAPLTPAPLRTVQDAAGHAPMYPAGVSPAASGPWYVADSGGSRLLTLDPATGATTPFVTAGLTDPRDLERDALDPSALWVTDTGGNRVVRISAAGAVTDVLTGLTQPYGLADDAARVYVADTYGNRVRSYARGGAASWTQTTCAGRAFSRPRDVGLLDSGELAVADTDNDRIVVLDAASGSCLRTIGTRGTAPGQLRAPRSVAADGAGGLWVADALNQRVQHLAGDGSVLGATPAGAFGGGPEQFRSPHCVAPVPDTTEVVVCDTFNFRLTVRDGTGTPDLLRTIGGTAPALGGFDGPFATAYGPDGTLYVADWFNHRIQRFAPDGQVSAWGGYGTANGSLIFPRGVLVSPAGEVVVTDSENNRIDVFTAEGTYLRQVRPPTGSALNRPHQTALDGTGGYWVADTGNSRVVHLGPTGAVLAAWPVAGGVAGRPEGVAVDVDGTLLVSNTRNNTVERYSTTGALLATVLRAGSGTGQVASPAALLVTGRGASRRLWVADAGNDRVVVLDAAGAVTATFGGSGVGAAQLDQPRAVAVDPTDGDIAVADFTNDRVSLWRPDGAVPPDADPPETTVSDPAAQAVLDGPTVTVRGTATDDREVASVAVLVKDRVSGLWLRPDGSWGPSSTGAARNADLDLAGAASTGWGLAVPLPPGSYLLSARARDAAGRQDATAATRQVTVRDPDRTPPDGTLTAPAAGAQVASGPLELRGAATDDVAVAAVRVAVQDAVTKQWLRADGSFAAGYATVTTVLGAPGSPTTSWSLVVGLPAGRRYGVSVIATDTAGNPDPTKPWSTFTVAP